MSRSDGSTHSVKEFARIVLPGGGFDAFSAVHFASSFPPHFHETFAIGVIETGAAMLRTPRGQWTARAGTILAFSPGEVHSAEPLANEGYTYRMLYPSLEFMREIGMDATGVATGTPLFRLPVIDDPVLGRELHDAHVPLMDGVANAAAEDAIVVRLRRLVERYGHVANDGAATSGRQSDRETVACAQRYMQERLARPVRLASVAEECGLNSFHLIRIFRRVVGVPPYAYLVQLRVNRAQTMLGEGFSVADVAYSCGFSDQSHLTRTFRKVIGVPPGQYVRSVRAA